MILLVSDRQVLKIETKSEVDSNVFTPISDPPGTQSTCRYSSIGIHLVVKVRY